MEDEKLTNLSRSMEAYIQSFDTALLESDVHKLNHSNATLRNETSQQHDFTSIKAVSFAVGGHGMLNVCSNFPSQPASPELKIRFYRVLPS
jgi:hypothetical protein